MKKSVGKKNRNTIRFIRIEYNIYIYILLDASEGLACFLNCTVKPYMQGLMTHSLDEFRVYSQSFAISPFNTVKISHNQVDIGML